ncbi:pirin family protein [Ruania halotolerans]|uniref:pirin family protein n=1 Tax=Ruania halotolerans TaxID=2897773 RepID=UPI001E3F10C1|nr:pirin family protein [Ruania halotolerans]UFU08030.1 pirin family protein [Ruania halotolerans]
MSNVEARPTEVVCAANDASDGPAQVRVLEPRAVPLGGPRAMSVRRTLPQRALSLIGAWCFVDHYGPDDVARSGGMDVAPHPHTGLQTVSWLFSGQIEHRDSAGHIATVNPGVLSLMTAGSGISHSERSTPETTTLHGVQLWVALPERERFGGRGFDTYEPPVVRGDGYSAQVFLGSAFGDTSPVATATELLGAELRLDPGAQVSLTPSGMFELGVLVDDGEVVADGVRVAPDHLAFREACADPMALVAGEHGARLLVIGGPAFGEQIVMWWNFVGRSHEEIVSFRAAWQAEIGAAQAMPGTAEPAISPETPGAGHGVPRTHFDLPEDPGDPLPAPTLPPVRIKPRGAG